MSGSPFDFEYEEQPKPLTAAEAAKTQEALKNIDNNAGLENLPLGAPGVITEAVYDKGKRIEPGAVGETNAKAGPASPYGNLNFDPTILAKYFEQQRGNDLQKGLDFGSKYFGEGNPEMAAILKTQKERALGLNQQEIQLMRERAGTGINQQMATGMRGLRGVQAGSGVRGGAAGAQAIPIVNQANQARAAAEQEIAFADMARRSTELQNYQNTLTGERTGLLGTGFGFAGLGAADRASAMDYGLKKDSLDRMTGSIPNVPEDKAWNASDAMKKWRDSGFDPRNSPWSQWMHENVGDPMKDLFGIDTSKYSPNQFFAKK